MLADEERGCVARPDGAGRTTTRLLPASRTPDGRMPAGRTPADGSAAKVIARA